MFDYVRADMRRYADLGGWVVNAGFWITLAYRFGAWSRGVQPRLVRLPFGLLSALVSLPFRVLFQVHLPSCARIGAGLLLRHPYLILVAGSTTLGSDCTIYHDVTLGVGPVPGCPQLADRVVVFPGARVLGGVRVGSNAHIGANAVVGHDVAEWSIVVASMGREIPKSMAKPILETRIDHDGKTFADTE